MQIETFQTAIKNRKMAKAKRRLPPDVSAWTLRRIQITIGQSIFWKLICPECRIGSHTPTSTPGTRNSSSSGSGRSSVKSTEETPNDIRISRRFPADQKPMTPRALRTKSTPDYCHVDRKLPNYSVFNDYPTEEYRHSSCGTGTYQNWNPLLQN